MFATLCLLATLVGCQHICIVSTDFVIGDPSSIANAVGNFNPSKVFATLQQQIPEIPQSIPEFGKMLPFAAPSRARHPSRASQGQHGPAAGHQHVQTHAEQLSSEELQRVVEPEISQVQQTNSGSKPQEIEKVRRIEAQKRPHGGAYKFCNQFGCHDCKPAEGAKCCDGFKYDRKANRCRELL